MAKVYTKKAVLKLFKDKGIKTRKGNDAGAELFGRLAKRVGAKRLTLNGKQSPIYYGEDDVIRILAAAEAGSGVAEESVVEVDDSMISEAPVWHGGKRQASKSKTGGNPRRGQAQPAVA